MAHNHCKYNMGIKSPRAFRATSAMKPSVLALLALLGLVGASKEFQRSVSLTSGSVYTTRALDRRSRHRCGHLQAVQAEMCLNVVYVAGN